MSIVIEEVIAETTAAPEQEHAAGQQQQNLARKSQSAWIERRDLARCMEQIARRRDRLDAE